MHTLRNNMRSAVYIFSIVAVLSASFFIPIFVTSAYAWTPEITVLGANPYIMTEGGNFTDPGATACDNHNNQCYDITNQIVVSGDIITTSTTVGTYIVKYDVQNSEGKKAPQKTRIIQIIEALIPNKPPVITLVDGEVTITIGDIFTEPGYIAEDPEDGIITANVVIGGDSISTTTPVGTYTIKYNVKDSKGLSADEKSRTIIVKDKPASGGGNEVKQACSDGRDNDNDGKIDRSDPGCHSNGNPDDDTTYTPGDNDETDPEPIITTTTTTVGGGSGAWIIYTPYATTTATTTIPDITSVGCSYLNEFIKRGAINNPEEVKKVQSFLRIFEGRSDISVTGFYDDASYYAVVAFQEKYRTDVLEPWGHKKGTGFVYLTTRKKINEIYCDKAFPLTVEQLAEVNTFRAYLANMEVNRATNMHEEGVISLPLSDGQSVSDHINNIVGMNNNTEDQEIGTNNTDKDTKMASEENTSGVKIRLQNMASVITGFFGDIFDSYWFVLLIILALVLYYVLRSLYYQDDEILSSIDENLESYADSENTKENIKDDSVVLDSTSDVVRDSLSEDREK